MSPFAPRSGSGGRRTSGGRGPSKGRMRRPMKRRRSYISLEKKGPIDYKDIDLLSKFVSERGKIAPRGYTGASASKQRELAAAIKKSRAVGLLKRPR